MYCQRQRLLLLLGYIILSTDGQTGVRLPPSIVKGPNPSLIFRSEDAITLECKAEGVPAVRYEWKQNGIELNLNSQNIRKEANGTITISPAGSPDEGYYQCFAKNQYGTAVSVTSHLRRAILESSSGTPITASKTVTEGQPFHIQAEVRRSFPKATFSWEMARDAVDQNPEGLQTSKRIQIADNGDLYFAYAKAEDELAGRIYKCTTYNPHLDVKAGGSYTKLTVQRASGNVSQFAPTLAFASETQTVAVIGGSVTLRCIFSGNPEPIISWRGPGNTLPIGRYTLDKENSEIHIWNITSFDEGDYVCSASNGRGQNQHLLQIRVEEIPRFRSAADGPRNVNVTEGDSYTFNCNAEAKPDAQVTWYQNGIPLDADNPLPRLVFSHNKKSLTIREVCRDCGDRSNLTDLTVIQCNASNIHGYAYSSGYLNVLKQTKIVSPLKEEAFGEMSRKQEFIFECNATSDPSTPPTVRWYKLDKDGNKVPVHEETPDIKIIQGHLVIRVAANGTEKWTKYHGVYKCIADNGYSQAEKIVQVFQPPPSWSQAPLVRLPPSIIKGPRPSIIFRSEDSVRLDCIAEGVPAVRYEWKKNGIELNLNTQNIRKEADGTITIAPALSFDEGYYQCFAKNQYGTAVSVTSHLRRAVLDSATGTPTVRAKTVQEGQPFHIQAEMRRSFPKATFSWEMENDTVDQNPVPLLTSKRIQIADNGDLYFAYAKAEDELDGRIYKSTTYNPYLDVTAGGSYTKLTVQRTSGGVSQFAPTLGFVSETQTVTVNGGSVTLRCFFSGNPEPSISWRGPGNTLPIGRYKLGKDNSEIEITNITSTDEGQYVCIGSNGIGQTQHLLQIRVEAIPTFRSAADGPKNVNVTEGDSYTFNCSTDAKPEAQVMWYQNGIPLDVDNPPRRFLFSNNKKKLTILNVCRDCVDRSDRQINSDLMVIQCNASNIHGYAYSSGYLNVLKRTVIMPPLQEEASADMSKDQKFRFECNATSDPSAPLTVRWFKLDGDDNKVPVQEEPPDIRIIHGDMVIRVAANGTENWRKYHGVYKCIADNGYSQAEKTVEFLLGLPTFRSAADGPRNVNVTEGDSYTFNCNANAKPEARITWYQNGKQVDVDNPPSRYVFSNNKKSLTIRNVCRDCKDRDSHSDLTVIQCNASNIHGYAFSSGYLNVLKRTAIMPPLKEEASGEMSKDQEFKFECIATSDPSTPVTVRWFKLDGDDNKVPVLEERPDIKIIHGALVIRVAANGTENWRKYHGVYKCIADNRYSQAEKTVEFLLEEIEVILHGESEILVDRHKEGSIQLKCSAKSNYGTPIKLSWFKLEYNNAYRVEPKPPVVTVEDGVLTINVTENPTDEWYKYIGNYKCVGNNEQNESTKWVNVRFNDYGEWTLDY